MQRGCGRSQGGRCDRLALHGAFGLLRALGSVAQAQKRQMHIVQAAFAVVRARRNTHDGVVALAPCEFIKSLVLVVRQQGQLNVCQQFVSSQHSGVQTSEKGVGRHTAFTAWAGQHQRSAQRQNAGWPLGSRVGIGQRSPQGAPVPNGRMRDVRCRLRQQRGVLCNERRHGYFSVSGERANAQTVAHHGDAAQLTERTNVDEQRGFGQAHVQRRQQGLPASQHAGSVAMLLEQGKHLGLRGRAEIVEGGGFHAVTSGLWGLELIEQTLNNVVRVEQMVNTAKTRASDVGLSSRKRLSAAEREQQILAGAVDFFARRGLEAQTRELADELGITHALLYHYFPTKSQLIERVYEQVIAGRWDTQWEVLLDSKLLAQDKLSRFYDAYLAAILTPEWLRTLVHSGLADGLIPQRYFGLLRDRLFPRLIRETRRAHGSRSRALPSVREEALMLGFHGGLIYQLGMLPLVYGQLFRGHAQADVRQQFISDMVQAYLAQAAFVVPQGQRAS